MRLNMEQTKRLLETILNVLTPEQLAYVQAEMGLVTDE